MISDRRIPRKQPNLVPILALSVALVFPVGVAEASGSKSSSAAKRPVAAKVPERKVQNRTPQAQRKAAPVAVSKAPASRPAQQTQRPQNVQRAVAAPVVSVAQQMGLRSMGDPLDLNSSVALVVDQNTGEVLFSKNDSAVLPIASLTKLMTGLVIAEAGLPMDEVITITRDDVDTYKGTSSRLAIGARLTRGELMHLSLMSSENRAAHALGRTFPGGMPHFVKQMNLKARQLGMTDTHYVEPTGLHSRNRSSARDLVTLVNVAYEQPILRDLSTSPSHEVHVGQRTLTFNNSNRLVRAGDWDIGLQKTGFIREAGRCLVMQANVAGRQLIMVFLDAAGSLSRAQDAERVRRWLEAQGSPTMRLEAQGIPGIPPQG
ncbi:MAG TPA: D-alanyl-D-alanine carboxypeptidase [Hydrogenophaga sp.]|uniref:serine hydrolase n=1 Tax=Hydrogenophaga sp. TaxID=1904254 RepID=UPI002C8E80CC|nr:serine hydrolase [Hydrogenophaga sp.]HMN92347.1 D-alanyl-D-alanine carboxypeptidase [Hydrogenophaga sp.]HMP11885.1 D-alanyl-D-alanine carboxypeptidase [Hydrogenophaga sp.]